ncbi:hypothetical protein DPF84_03485 [Enterobacter hormaechei]|uniref:hypothetical protein n=1 Tax=Enterobacter hormaechei TaxID=158836 RepID=UPI000DBF0DF1|nr:hypothetical protein [Enterobacter hormaechei]AWX00862.1 hypothetical protein DPF84_03485 [Enterobacter hormaechei]MDF3709856.1 hypothetical protein [Enterobacter hormaechei]RAM41912.1 hypothetical protein DOZ52_15645 [Enterobacter hormaechei]
MSVKRYDYGYQDGYSADGMTGLQFSDDGALVKYEDYAALEARCAALAAEAQGFKRFFMFAINAAFDGCDITGDQIQEVAKEIGLVRVESYSAEKHAEMSGDPSVMEEGDDFYILNKTPATDAFLAEVRASAIEHAASERWGSGYVFDELNEIAAQIRKGVQS